MDSLDNNSKAVLITYFELYNLSLILSSLDSPVGQNTIDLPDYIINKLGLNGKNISEIIQAASDRLESLGCNLDLLFREFHCEPNNYFINDFCEVVVSGTRSILPMTKDDFEKYRLDVVINSYKEELLKINNQYTVQPAELIRTPLGSSIQKNKPK